MQPLRKLDRYILQKFLLVFLGAFFICLFVFMMQFTWRYVDELIGKGLTLDILGRFFWYMGLSLVPQALPLGVLLASLITFGNMGESLELLAMKAAGVPLIRIMRPILYVVVLLTGLSFYFQNNTAPEAQVSMRTLLFSMKQQSPAVEIPEGVFYSGVPNVNLFVQKKNAETGMLRQVIIYKTDQGFDRAQIVLADSGRMEMTADKLHLRLELWNGEQFESLQSTGTAMTGAGKMMKSQPYDRETFNYKELLIDFDSNFNELDKEMLANMPQAKDMSHINHDIDSMSHRLDSIARANYRAATVAYYPKPRLSRRDSTTLSHRVGKEPVSFDSLLARLPAAERENINHQAAQLATQAKADLEWKGLTIEEGDNYIRRHQIEWHTKISLALACLMFFFVGAPLGAIIRKGGLGMPTVISVAIFIFYYIINTSGMKMARDGSINMVWGMWVSTIIISPFGAIITYKSNKDSVVFNTDLYIALLRRLLGLRTKRHITRKEVIINDPHYEQLTTELQQLATDCRAYNEQAHLTLAPSYANTFFRYHPDTEAEHIAERIEAIVEEFSNSRRREELQAINRLPSIYAHAHVSPFHNRHLNMLAGIFFPLGLLLWLRMWRFRLRLHKDLKTVLEVCERLQALMQGETTEDQAEAGDHQAAVKSKRIWRKRRKRILYAIILITLGIVAANAIRNAKQRSTLVEEEKESTETAAPKHDMPTPPINPRFAQ